MSNASLDSATALSWQQPVDGEDITLPDSEIWCMLPRELLRKAILGEDVDFCGRRWHVVGRDRETLYLEDSAEGAHMAVMADETFPVITAMENNPLEIDWDVEM